MLCDPSVITHNNRESQHVLEQAQHSYHHQTLFADFCLPYDHRHDIHVCQPAGLEKRHIPGETLMATLLASTQHTRWLLVEVHAIGRLVFGPLSLLLQVAELQRVMDQAGLWTTARAAVQSTLTGRI